MLQINRYCLLCVLSVSSITLLAAATTQAQDVAMAPGLLDKPLIPENTTQVQVTNVRPAAAAPMTPEEIQQQVREEQDELEQLPRNALMDRAEDGERAAQVALGTDYAKEAAMLGVSPAAANDALRDAAEWYSRAAGRGFPGAPSLDTSGIRFYPVRKHR